MPNVIVHYAEIALKGKNRSFFEKKLQENIKRSIKGKYRIVKREYDRIIVYLAPRAKRESVESALKRVFGIEWFAFVHESKKDVKEIKKVIKKHAKIKKGETAKIIAKRSDKGFSLTSPQINVELGNFINEKLGAKIDVHHPKHEIYVNIGAKAAYIYFNRVRGPGGLPVGSSGKTLVLFSGGIDSAVATYLLMKRGSVPYYLHFHAFRKGKEAMKGKIEDMVKKLARHGGTTKVFLVPFHPFQFAVSRAGRDELVVFRRFMMRIAEEIAKENNMQAIVTGESLGQVASQTMENITTIDAATSMSVFRPLLSYDKREIIDLAKNIETYKLAIKDYKDCCAIVAKHPKTKSRLKDVLSIEEEIDMEKLVKDTLKQTEVLFAKK